MSETEKQIDLLAEEIVRIREAAGVIASVADECDDLGIDGWMQAPVTAHDCRMVREALGGGE